jgi:CheY-like chemotaxis protein
LKKIFLVDDDPISIFLTKKIIGDFDGSCEISDFADAGLALEHLKSNADCHSEQPNIIFIDLNMPVMDGWDFLDEYSLLQPRMTKPIAIYVTSASILSQDVQRAQSYTIVNDLLLKPISKEKIEAILTDTM